MKRLTIASLISLLLLPSGMCLSNGFDRSRSPDQPDSGRLESETFLWIDFDRDGLDDLYVIRSGTPGTLYRNEGDGGFSEAAAPGGSRPARRTNHASWADYDNDGYPDLYLVRDGRNLLYKNLDGIEFVETGEETGLDDDGEGRIARWLDYDRDGYVDLQLDNRSGTILFHNERDGRFEKVPGLYQAAARAGEVQSGRLRGPGSGSMKNLNGSNHRTDAESIPGWSRDRMNRPASGGEPSGGEPSSGTGYRDGESIVPADAEDQRERGWFREYHLSKAAPDGLIWVDNTSDGVSIRGQSDDGTGVHALSSGTGLALKAEGASRFDGSVAIGTAPSDLALDIAGTARSTTMIAPDIKASGDESVPTIDFDTLPNNAQGSGITIGKKKAMAGQNNGQPYMWIRGNGAQSWILDYTQPGTAWAQSMGAYYNNIKQGNLGFLGIGPTVDYLSIGFGGAAWWNEQSKFIIWKTGRAQFMPPSTPSLNLEEPPAWLVLAPGSSAPSGAPLMFRAGELLAEPEAGALEWDGYNLYITDASAIRRKIVFESVD